MTENDSLINGEAISRMTTARERTTIEGEKGKGEVGMEKMEDIKEGETGMTRGKRMRRGTDKMSGGAKETI